MHSYSRSGCAGSEGRRGAVRTAVLASIALLAAPACLAHNSGDELLASTFSIVAIDPETGELGIAVASKVLAVGHVVPWIEPGVGAIATQALANPDYGSLGLDLLRDGLSPQDALDSLLSIDPGSDSRQVGVVSASGEVAAFTGSGTLAWSGHRMGEAFTCQGNILVGEEVLLAMEEAFLSAEGPLASRLLAALIAGDDAGGDSRGRQSAALLVVRERGGYLGSTDRLVDLRVDDSEEPVTELARLYDLWAPYFMLQAYLDSEGEAEQRYAFEILERALAREGEDPQLLNAMAWYLAERGLEPGRALELALRAHELAPEDANIMDTVAQAFFSAGQFAEAVEWERRALEIEPGNSFFQEQLQRFLSTIGPQ
ncbi:DUF1028 domain-containing protein [Candidatus Fermentibacterales bacterium]|nr:DUF1028 domain-containing protein [Candidatus Fermentibacterales bacterium]